MKSKKRLTALALLLFLLGAVLLAGCRGSEKPQVEEEVVKMAENCIAAHVLALETKGVSQIDAQTGKPRLVRVPVEESELRGLALLETWDVTEKMKGIEGFAATTAAAIEIYDFSYRLKPEPSPELTELAASGPVALDEDGWMNYDGDVLLALNCDGTYIELAENLYSKELYQAQREMIVQRNLGSDMTADILKTDRDYALRVGEILVGLGLYSPAEELPLALDWGEALPDLFGPGSSGVTISYEEGGFITKTVDYYEFNQAEPYSACVYIRDCGGFAQDSQGVRVGDSEEQFFAAYAGSILLRYDSFDDEGLSWKKNDCVYAKLSSVGDALFRTERIYLKDGFVTAVELEIFPETERNEKIPDDGYYASLVRSQTDCVTVAEGYRKYERFGAEGDRGVYDVSFPEMKPEFAGAAAFHAAAAADWSAILTAPENGYREFSSSGFAQPVIKVYFQEYQIGSLYEICVFLQEYSGAGSGVNYRTCRYVYDPARERLLTDEEFLAALQYDQAYVVEQCREQCLAAEDREQTELTYEDIRERYFVDERGRLQFTINFYS